MSRCVKCGAYEDSAFESNDIQPEDCRSCRIETLEAEVAKLREQLEEAKAYKPLVCQRCLHDYTGGICAVCAERELSWSNAVRADAVNMHVKLEDARSTIRNLTEEIAYLRRDLDLEEAGRVTAERARDEWKAKARRKRK